MRSTLFYRRLIAIAAGVMLFAISAVPASAEDYFLTIGGGYDPTSNQLSLERNVQFQQRVLKRVVGDDVKLDVFFADGDLPDRDLVYRDPAFKCPSASRILAEVLGSADEIDLKYRDHKIKNVAGPAKKGHIENRLRRRAHELKSGDRLFIYVTGHGGEAESADDDYNYYWDGEQWVANYDEDAETDEYSNEGEEDQAASQDTTIHLWGEDSVAASEFAKWLDRLPADVPVICVMVQCHSGGFANVIFQQANPELGLSSRPRCGFFSQLYDRGAAGCTPDADEADYQEYSSFFWAALGGRSRTGQAVTSADYDGDGQVSFAEAHAYAVLESDTVDIPIRTSDAFLRHYSEVGTAVAAVQEEPEPVNPLRRAFQFFSGGGKADQQAEEQQPAIESELMPLAGPLADLLPHARPAERVVLQQLAAQHELDGDTDVAEFEQLTQEAETAMNRVETRYSAASQTYFDTQSDTQEQLYRLWPELRSESPPILHELLGDGADDFVRQVESLPEYQAMCTAQERLKTLEEELLAAAHHEAKLQRLLRTAENVVLAANLDRCAPEEIVARYRELVALEESALGPTSPDASHRAETTTAD